MAAITVEAITTNVVVLSWAVRSPGRSSFRLRVSFLSYARDYALEIQRNSYKHEGRATRFGAPQYTGARSETASVQACISNEPPTQSSLAVETIPSSGPAFDRFSGYKGLFADPSFASTVSQRLSFLDGSVGEAVDKCDVGDLCALIRYRNGDRLAIYSEGAANCEPYVLYFSRTNGNRTIYAFSRNVDHDA
jgi:hypothetical protein